MDELNRLLFMKDDILDWNGYKIHRINESFIDHLIQISESAFNISPERSYYQLKNNTASFGEPYLGYIALDAQGSPAAFYGVYACEVVLDGKKYKAAQSGDTMTHKSHGGKGLFTILAKRTYELCKRLDIDFVFGFPNYNSYPGFVKKLDWVCPGTLNEYRIKVATLPLMKVAKKFKAFGFLYGFYLRFVNIFFKSTDVSLPSSVLKNGVGGIERSHDFIKYKMAIGGSYILSVNEVNVWLKSDGFLLIGDVNLTSGIDFAEFIKKLKKYAFLVGADVLMFQTMPSSPLDDLFRKEFTSEEAFPYGYCKLNSKVDPLKFHFVMADSDTF